MCVLIFHMNKSVAFVWKRSYYKRIVISHDEPNVLLTNWPKAYSYLCFTAKVCRLSSFLMAARAAWLRSCERKPFKDMNARPHCLQVCLSPLDFSSGCSRSVNFEGDDRGLVGKVKVSTGVTFHWVSSPTVSNTGSSSCLHIWKLNTATVINFQTYKCRSSM